MLRQYILHSIVFIVGAKKIYRKFCRGGEFIGCGLLIADHYITMENYFLDGTKIEANASKYSFVWKKSTLRFEEKLKEKIQASGWTCSLSLLPHLLIHGACHSHTRHL